MDEIQTINMEALKTLCEAYDMESVVRQSASAYPGAACYTYCEMHIKAAEEMIEDELVEMLAALEHEQWRHWSKSIDSTEAISPKRYKRWVKLWCPYAELSEEMKEFDRIWARKVIDVLIRHGRMHEDKSTDIEEGQIDKLVEDMEDTIQGYDAEYSNPAGTSARIWTALKKDLKQLLIAALGGK